METVEIIRFGLEIVTTVALVATFAAVLYYAIQVKRSVAEMVKQRMENAQPCVTCELLEKPGESEDANWIIFPNVTNVGRGPAINLKIRVTQPTGKFEPRSRAVIGAGKSMGRIGLPMKQGSIEEIFHPPRDKKVDIQFELVYCNIYHQQFKTVGLFTAWNKAGRVNFNLEIKALGEPIEEKNKP